MDTERFGYEALPTANSIRLLELLEEDEAELLRLTIKDADLDDRPTYNCLSYTWGAAQPLLDHHGQPTSDLQDVDSQWPVLCDGKMMMVGQNLYDFLQHLLRLRQAIGREDGSQELTRLLHDPGEPVQSSDNLYLPIWIDALCINQDDISERSSQVRMMGSIYQTAQTIIVWLGAEGRETAGAIGTIKQLLNERREEKTKYFADLTIHPMNYHDSRMFLGLNEALG